METTTSKKVKTLSNARNASPDHQRNQSPVLSIEPSSPTQMLDIHEGIIEQPTENSPVDQRLHTHAIPISKSAEHSSQSSDEDDSEDRLQRESPKSASTNCAHFTQWTRNKRKNFNPRCSAGDLTNVEARDVCSENSANKNDIVIKLDERLGSNAHAENGNKLPSQRITRESRSVGQKMDVSPDAIATDLSGHRNIESNFSSEKLTVAEMQKALLAASSEQTNFAAITNAAAYTAPSAIDNVGLMLKQHLTSVTNSALKHTTQSFINHQQQTFQSGDPDPKPLQFACNAFNAVQELLKTYGIMQISPNDIVDALKNQANSGE